MKSGLGFALMAVTLVAASSARAGPALEKQVVDALTAKFAYANPYFADVKSDASGHVCGLISLNEGFGGGADQLRFLSNPNGKIWLEGLAPDEAPPRYDAGHLRRAADFVAGVAAARKHEARVRAAYVENDPVWKTCHR